MAKILVLAKSGFGKTTSYCGRKKLGIKGLNPKETFVIQCIGRAVPNPEFKLCPSTNVMDMVKGNRMKLVLLECTNCKKTYNQKQDNSTSELCSTCNEKILKEKRTKDALRKSLNRDERVSSSLERLGGIDE